VHLSPGARLGPYEIVEPLGVGGMGEVSRARDTRLGREVAIKIILEPFSADADRVARFQREAKVLASLNHPHIAALYGMEEAGGQHFIVMELVEGQTLADRLTRGPLDVDEALAIGVQIAEALEAAHEKGVVHRDLKPANIKVTPDDSVKVLDFGLAKAIESEAVSANAANSPTLSMMASQAGIILGTAAYMSPEQAKGLPADHRSDIFSFGSVFFEMVTGRQPFQGDTAPDVLASVLVREADLTRLPTDLHPRLTELIRRCLEKQPKRRWQAIGDVRAELEAIAATPKAAATTVGSVQPPRPLWRRAMPATISALVAGVLAGTAAWTLKPAPSLRIVRFAIPLPADAHLTAIPRRGVAISPDGSLVAYVANQRIDLRPLGETRSSPIVGTESPKDVLLPTFSPDSRSIAFYSAADSTLKRIDVTGGAAVRICSVEQNPTGLSWGKDGILISEFAPTGGTVWRVPPDIDANPQRLLSLNPGEIVVGAEMLPDGDTVLLTVGVARLGPNGWDKAQVIAWSLKSGTRTVLIPVGSGARYLRSGYLAYAVGGVLYGWRFNAQTLTFSGEPFEIVDGVRRDGTSGIGGADFSVSNDGTLAYVTGPPTASDGSELVLADRQGVLTTLPLSRGEYSAPRVTRAGERIALEVSDGRSKFIGTYDVNGSTGLQRITYGPNANSPVWSQDGTQVAFQVERDGDRAIFAQPADRSAEARPITTPRPGEAHVPQSWYGDVLLFDVVVGSNVSLYQVSLKDGTTAPFGDVHSSTETGAVFSPDGKWVAYSTTDKGATQPQLSVQPFPATGRPYKLVQPTASAAQHPLWTPDGSALLYLPAPGYLERVPVQTQPAFVFGNPERLPRPFQGGPPGSRRLFDMMPDGRILAFKNSLQTVNTQSDEIHVWLNWFEDINRRVTR
jgi:serine/threonine-protein kinase